MKKMKISKIISYGILLAVVYVIFNSFFIDLMLQTYGTCTKAYIYVETSPGRTAPNFKYKFYVGSIDYYALIGKENGLKIGDSVCIVYWAKMPYKNRPLGYFEGKKIKCDCNK